VGEVGSSFWCNSTYLGCDIIRWYDDLGSRVVKIWYGVVLNWGVRSTELKDERLVLKMSE